MRTIHAGIQINYETESIAIFTSENTFDGFEYASIKDLNLDLLQCLRLLHYGVIDYVSPWCDEDEMIVVLEGRYTFDYEHFQYVEVKK